MLVAYKNTGTNLNIIEALDKLSERTIKMPGAMCGYWGVCGSTASVGAALSIINNTTPLSDNNYYKENMEFTSYVINQMSKIGGPRCCKRNAFLSLNYAVKFLNEKYNCNFESNKIICVFSSKNKQCIKTNCPFYHN